MKRTYPEMKKKLDIEDEKSWNDVVTELLSHNVVNRESFFYKYNNNSLYIWWE